jgi:hypothetical protein
MIAYLINEAPRDVVDSTRSRIAHVLSYIFKEKVLTISGAIDISFVQDRTSMFEEHEYRRTSHKLIKEEGVLRLIRSIVEMHKQGMFKPDGKLEMRARVQLVTTEPTGENNLGGLHRSPIMIDENHPIVRKLFKLNSRLELSPTEESEGENLDPQLRTLLTPFLENRGRKAVLGEQVLQENNLGTKLQNLLPPALFALQEKSVASVAATIFVAAFLYKVLDSLSPRKQNTFPSMPI